jgi:hypothetical protein
MLDVSRNLRKTILDHQRRNRLIFEEKGDRITMESVGAIRRGRIHGHVASKPTQRFALIEITRVLRAT